MAAHAQRANASTAGHSAASKARRALTRRAFREERGALISVPLAFFLAPVFGFVLAGAFFLLGVLFPLGILRAAGNQGPRRLINQGRLRWRAEAWWTGWEELKLLGCEPAFRRDIRERLAGLERIGTRQARQFGWEDSVSQAVAAATQWSLVFALAPLAAGGVWSPPLLGAALLGGIASLEAFQSLGTAALRARELRAANRRVGPAGWQTLGVTGGEAARSGGVPSVKGWLVLEKFGAGYERARPVLHPLTTNFSPAGLTFIIGPSGSRKSTFFRALLRQTAWTSGTCRFGDRDTETWPDRHVPAQFSAARQGGCWFHESLRTNFHNANASLSDPDMEEELERLGLAERIRNAPGGLDACFGENGSELSGGEKQRLILLRALLRPAPFVLVDEPTDGLDLFHSETVWKRLRREANRRGVLVATHDFTAIRPEDPVLFFQQGHLAESGTCRVLQHGDGLFARWCGYVRDLV